MLTDIGIYHFFILISHYLL